MMMWFWRTGIRHQPSEYSASPCPHPSTPSTPGSSHWEQEPQSSCGDLMLLWLFTDPTLFREREVLVPFC